jgi:hypothetical protein
MPITARQSKTSAATDGNCLPDTVHSAIHTGMRNLSGQPAIPFSLADSSGRIHTLNDYRGSWLLMVFHRHLG